MIDFKQLLKGTGLTYAVNEKAPEFLNNNGSSNSWHGRFCDSFAFEWIE